MSKINKQKGVSLYLAIMIMIILLAVVLGLSTILLGQLKIIKGMENSVIAFYAADTGIERVLRIYYKEGTPGNIPLSDYQGFLDIDGIGGTGTDCPYDLATYPNDACYKVDVVQGGSGDCGDANVYCVESVGIYKGTRRAIETELEL